MSRIVMIMSQGPSEENPYQIPASFSLEENPASFGLLEEEMVPPEVGQLLLSTRPWLRGIFTAGCIGLTIQSAIGLYEEEAGRILLIFSAVAVIEGIALMLLWRFMAALHAFQRSSHWPEFKTVFRAQAALLRYVGVVAGIICILGVSAIIFTYFLRFQ